jgi:hypothetical protein
MVNNAGNSRVLAQMSRRNDRDILEILDQVLFQPDFNPDWELRAPLSLTIQDYAYEMLAAFFL